MVRKSSLHSELSSGMYNTWTSKVWGYMYALRTETLVKATLEPCSPSDISRMISIIRTVWVCQHYILGPIFQGQYVKRTWDDWVKPDNKKKDLPISPRPLTKKRSFSVNLPFMPSFVSPPWFSSSTCPSPLRIPPIHKASKKALWLNTHQTFASALNTSHSLKKAPIAECAASSAPGMFVGTWGLEEEWRSIILWW